MQKKSHVLIDYGLDFLGGGVCLPVRIGTVLYLELGHRFNERMWSGSCQMHGAPKSDGERFSIIIDWRQICSFGEKQKKNMPTKKIAMPAFIYMHDILLILLHTACIQVCIYLFVQNMKVSIGRKQKQDDVNGKTRYNTEIK